jgi:large subunit ribosomal protein L29
VTTAADIRELRDNEINQRLQESYEELWNIRFKHATNQLSNNRDIRRVRKEIARLKTVQREREIGAATAPQQEQ